MSYSLHLRGFESKSQMMDYSKTSIVARSDEEWVSGVFKALSEAFPLSWPIEVEIEKPSEDMTLDDYKITGAKDLDENTTAFSFQDVAYCRFWIHLFPPFFKDDWLDEKGRVIVCCHEWSHGITALLYHQATRVAFSGPNRNFTRLANTVLDVSNEQVVSALGESIARVVFPGLFNEIEGIER